MVRICDTATDLSKETDESPDEMDTTEASLSAPPRGIRSIIDRLSTYY
jgi:hypothetical protein